MDKFIISISPDKVQVYYNNGHGEKYSPFNIQGEEYLLFSEETSLEVFTMLKEQILDVLNLENFNEVGFEVVYKDIKSESIKQLSEVMLPCGWWQVFTEKKISEDLQKTKQYKRKVSESNKMIKALQVEQSLLNQNIQDLSSKLAQEVKDKGLLHTQEKQLKIELNEKKEKLDVVYKWIDEMDGKETININELYELKKKLGLFSFANIAKVLSEAINSIFNLSSGEGNAKK